MLFELFADQFAMSLQKAAPNPISKLFDVSPNTIRNAHKWFQNGCPETRRQGAPEKLTEEIKAYIYLKTLTSPTITGQKLSTIIEKKFNVKVSRTTVNYCRDAMHFKYLNYVPCLHLSPIAKMRRMAFANSFLGGNISYLRVLFSDEKWFYRSSLKGKCWRLVGYVQPEVTKPNELHPEKVMVWGAVGHDFKSKLVFLTGNITAPEYIRQVLQESLIIEDANAKYGEKNW
jgi:hypothetical protein